MLYYPFQVFISHCLIVFNFATKLTIQQLFSSFQLYEISDDPKRREFLDDLFAYMQKRGMFLHLFSTVY